MGAGCPVRRLRFSTQDVADCERVLKETENLAGESAYHRRQLSMEGDIAIAGTVRSGRAFQLHNDGGRCALVGRACAGDAGRLIIAAFMGAWIFKWGR
jgi:hypothetical protein